jgi:hypothetical protein
MDMKKSDGAKSDNYGECFNAGIYFSAKNSFTRNLCGEAYPYDAKFIFLAKDLIFFGKFAPMNISCLTWSVLNNKCKISS